MDIVCLGNVLVRTVLFLNYSFNLKCIDLTTPLLTPFPKLLTSIPTEKRRNSQDSQTCTAVSRQPTANSRQPTADSQQPIADYKSYT